MLIDPIIEDPRWTEAHLTALSETAAAQTLAHLGLAPTAYEIALLGCDDARIATLNTEFRSKPTPTNVLSWPDQDLAAEADGGAPERPEADPHAQEEPLFLGDIAIAAETVVAEAHEQQKSVRDHLAHMVVHGTLHLLGYDHEADDDAQEMEALEREILKIANIADPYRAQVPS